MDSKLRFLAKTVKEWGDPKRDLIDFKDGKVVYPRSSYFCGYPYSKKAWEQARYEIETEELHRIAWMSNSQTSEEEEAMQALDKKLNGENEKYSAYFKDVRHLDYIDVYRTVSLFDCDRHGHALSHAAKKLLLTGNRTGGKDVETDVREAIDSLRRWLEMREEDQFI